jgi:hypothetical protein
VQISRRAVLGTAVLLAAGCHRRVTPTPPAAPPDPDAAALNQARNLERLLLASYDAKLAVATGAQRPPLEQARALHAMHLRALRGSPTSSSDIAVEADLHQALRTSAATLRQLSLTAVDGPDAALLASIAGSHTASAR